MRITYRAKLVALGAAAAMALTACGSPAPTTSDSPSQSESAPTNAGSWTLGTTDTLTSIDPAGGYDIGSWNLQYTAYEQLLRVPAGSPEPVGDAAEKCEYNDPKTVTCTLRAGNKFSNGHDLTSSDVKFSFERNLLINDPNGSSVLLSSIADKPGVKGQKLTEGAIETPDETTVIFHLNRADTTFLALLATATNSIVDEEVFPADKLQPDDQIIGSGPLTLTAFTKGQLATFEKNANYTGSRVAQSDQVLVQYFSEAAALRQALENEEIDVAWRTFSPTDLTSLESNEKVKVYNGEGSEYRYWVFQLGTEVGKNKAIRQAVAQIIDRDAITKNAYDGIKTPAYSVVPVGFGGEKDSFKEKYGATPNVEAAKKTLADAGVKTPIDITLGYPPEHYGAEAVDEATELSGQLKATGLFNVDVKSAEWTEYQNLYKENAYDLFLLGWYPDIMDSDNYLTPFFPEGGFYKNNYNNKDLNKILDQELAETDVAARNALIGQAQDIVAEDVPQIPSWNGKNTGVALPSVNGVLETLDASYIFRLWTISKNT